MDSNPRKPHINIIDYKWIFYIKHYINGNIECYKDYYIVKGFFQIQGID